jgi:hypothetical protein
MIVTELSLVEYYEKIIPRAKRKNYKWVISVIARHADAKELYQHIEEDWASINDLTYDNVLFVFSLGENLKNNSFFHTEGRESYVGTMCPYVETLNEERIANKKDDFYLHVCNEADIDWKQKHSQSVTEFIRKYDIREEQLPVLFIWNLEKNCYSVVSMKQNEDMYSFLKQCILEQENLMKQKQKLEMDLLNFKQERMYFELYDCLKERACRFESNEKEAVQSVLSGQSSYLEKKDQIQDKKIRSDLKKIGQWEKQFFSDSLDIPQIKIHVNEILKQKTEIECRIDSVWEKIGNKGETFTLINDIVTDVIFICAKLISNEIYYGVSEDRRNTYVRDLLDEKGYAVRDQTRHGLSPKGKDAGIIDISIFKDGNTCVLIEALNLSYLRKNYIDNHLDKIFGYDVLGNEINIILNYVTVSDFDKFITNYIVYMKERKWCYPMVDLDEKCDEYKIPYSSIRVIKTIHKRNGKNTSLYHICALINGERQALNRNNEL